MKISHHQRSLLHDDGADVVRERMEHGRETTTARSTGCRVAARRVCALRMVGCWAHSHTILITAGDDCAQWEMGRGRFKVEPASASASASASALGNPVAACRSGMGMHSPTHARTSRLRRDGSTTVHLQGGPPSSSRAQWVLGEGCMRIEDWRLSLAGHWRWRSASGGRGRVAWRKTWYGMCTVDGSCPKRRAFCISHQPRAGNRAYTIFLCTILRQVIWTRSGPPKGGRPTVDTEALTERIVRWGWALRERERERETCEAKVERKGGRAGGQRLYPSCWAGTV
ncbi:hypothetical protein K431DRAFT_32672 [Polychaeton citri CBS 116435]|uniref:Uncharacterized protein n=1 Tax=Polychaeton citri CBS 116435 TaxID=1314669 RepID=A0A9P4URT0_9PEZI|nr:hypothetical protein K431DRAFT_32672 [Polychaeton citri CBS 116435]